MLSPVSLQVAGAEDKLFVGNNLAATLPATNGATVYAGQVGPFKGDGAPGAVRGAPPAARWGGHNGKPPDFVSTSAIGRLAIGPLTIGPLAIGPSGRLIVSTYKPFSCHPGP